MALLFLILFVSALIFLFYYELVWKKIEEERGINFVSMARGVVFGDTQKKGRPASPDGGQGGPKIQLISRKTPQTNWGDWKYRLIVELHRRDRLGAKDAADILGISEDRIERYMDKLEGEGKIQQVGDAERGVYYKITSEQV